MKKDKLYFYDYAFECKMQIFYNSVVWKVVLKNLGLLGRDV